MDNSAYDVCLIHQLHLILQLTGLFLTSIFTNGVERMHALLHDGKVGIGTSAPAETLTVAGNISAQGDKVLVLVMTNDYLMGSLLQCVVPRQC